MLLPRMIKAMPGSVQQLTGCFRAQGTLIGFFAQPGSGQSRKDIAVCASYLTDALDAAGASPGAPKAIVITPADRTCHGSAVHPASLTYLTLCCLRSS